MTAIEAINLELNRLHVELASLDDPSCFSYTEILEQIKSINETLCELALINETLCELAQKEKQCSNQS